MKYSASLLFIILCSIATFGQKLTKADKTQKKLCDKYCEIIDDDLGDGPITRIKSIRVGPALWVTANRKKDQKNLAIILKFSGSMTKEIAPD